MPASESIDGTYRFCPRCGAPLRFAVAKASEPARPTCTTCGFVVYLDPKVAVGTIITNASDEIALVKRAIEPGYGKWVFPGGYVDRGETLLAAAAREAWEEAHLEIGVTGLVNLYSYSGRTPIIVVYAANETGGTLRADDESLEAAWFGADNLPWEELAFPSTRDALRDYLNGVLHPHAR